MGSKRYAITLYNVNLHHLDHEESFASYDRKLMEHSFNQFEKSFLDVAKENKLAYILCKWDMENKTCDVSILKGKISSAIEKLLEVNTKGVEIDNPKFEFNITYK